MDTNYEFNLSNNKICRLCATRNMSGYELLTPSSKNLDKNVRTICGYIGRESVDNDLQFKWLCTSCHSAGTATIEYLHLVKSGQEKLGLMIEKLKLENAEKQIDLQENKFIQMPADENDPAPIRKVEKIAMPPNICTASKIDTANKPLCVTLDSNKRQRRAPKRLLEEISGKALQRKKTPPIVITPLLKEIDSCTLITSQSIAEFRSAAGEALGEVIEVAPEASTTSGPKDEYLPHLKTYFICEFCKAAFAKRYDFVQHIATHKNCIYECSACLQNFQTKCSFDEHQAETGHDGCGIIEFATAADRTDENVNAAAINIVVGTNGQITSIIGNEINNKGNTLHYPEIKNNESFNISSQSLNNIAKKLANSMYACLHCSKAFENIYTVRRHYQLVHVAVRAYKCKSCSASFKTNYSLNVHQATHTGEKRHCCNFCEKTFITKHAWKIHTRIHTGEKPFKCKDCPKSFANRGNLMTHSRVHTGERPYKCTTCKLCFKSLSNLKKHKTIHLRDLQGKTIQNNQLVTKPVSRQLHQSSSSLLKPIKPEIQSVIIIPPTNNLPEITNKISLDSNFKNVKGTTDTIDPTSLGLTTNSVSSSTAATDSALAVASKSTYRFRCSVCFKQFNQCCAFKKHQRTHTGERPYKCHMCPKAFTDPSNYKKHKMLHKNATYALKIESEKQKTHNLRQLLDDHSSVDLKDSKSLSPSSAASDPDPDGLEVIQRLDTRRQSCTSSLPSESGDVNTINSDHVLNKKLFSTWNKIDYSILQPKFINEIGVSEGTKNKLKARNNTTEVPSSFSLAADSKQIICISYQDPTNPVGKKTTTFYAID